VTLVPSCNRNDTSTAEGHASEEPHNRRLQFGNAGFKHRELSFAFLSAPSSFSDFLTSIFHQIVTLLLKHLIITGTTQIGGGGTRWRISWISSVYLLLSAALGPRVYSAVPILQHDQEMIVEKA
jgi:hypothetical protein